MKPTPFHKFARRRIAAGIFILAVTSLPSAILACTAVIPAGKITATPSPTGQIGAMEIGTDAPVDKKNWQVWAGSITSQTSRQYKSNGSVVNTCITNWKTDIFFTIDPVGNISGVGSSDLTDDPTCSPIAISGNTTYMVISVSGRRDQTNIYLDLGTTDVEPMPSADFGGFLLLTSTGTCPVVKQSITIPFTSPTTAQATLDLSAVMMGCAGSSDDQMTNQSQVELHFDFLCADNPFAPSDPNAKICD